MEILVVVRVAKLLLFTPLATAILLFLFAQLVVVVFAIVAIPVDIVDASAFDSNAAAVWGIWLSSVHILLL